MKDAEQPPSARTSRRASRLEIASDGGWFRLGDGELVDLSRRPALRNVLLALAQQRVRSPGLAASSGQLFATAWPGEHIAHALARNRLYVAINALRELGLRSVIVRRAGGYLIPPRIVLEQR